MPEGPTAGVGFLAGGSELPLPQWGPGRRPGKFGFWSILRPQKSRQNGQLAFESGGATSESGGDKCPPCPNVEPPLQITILNIAIL